MFPDRVSPHLSCRPPFKYWKATTRSLRSVLISRLSAFPHRRGVPALWPFLWPFWTHSHRSVFFLCWGVRSWTEDSRWGLTRAEQRGRIPPPLTCWPRCFWCSPGYGWLSGLQAHTAGSYSVYYPPEPRSPSPLLSTHSTPSLYPCLGLSRPRCSTLHLAMLNFMGFAWAHSSSLSRALWTASRPSRVSTTPLSFVARFSCL